MCQLSSRRLHILKCSTPSPPCSLSRNQYPESLIEATRAGAILTLSLYTHVNRTHPFVVFKNHERVNFEIDEPGSMVEKKP